MRYESQERVVIGSEWKGSICIAVVPIKIIIKTHWNINHKQIYWPSYPLSYHSHEEDKEDSVYSIITLPDHPMIHYHPNNFSIPDRSASSAASMVPI